MAAGRARSAAGVTCGPTLPASRASRAASAATGPKATASTERDIVLQYTRQPHRRPLLGASSLRASARSALKASGCSSMG
jgi:hypothetical protein